MDSTNHGLCSTVVLTIKKNSLITVSAQFKPVLFKGQLYSTIVFRDIRDHFFNHHLKSIWHPHHLCLLAPWTSFKHLSQWWSTDFSRQPVASSDVSIRKCFLIWFQNCLPAARIPWPEFCLLEPYSPINIWRQLKMNFLSFLLNH